MDTAACALCKQNNIPIVVFDFEAKGSIKKILHSEDIAQLGRSQRQWQAALQ